MENIQEIIRELIVKVDEAHSDLVRQLLTDPLKREPTSEDYKKCQRLHELSDNGDGYILQYEGIKLGRVCQRWEQPKLSDPEYKIKMMWVFIPEIN